MRDIRQDLRQRLGSLREERDRLQAQLKAKLVEIDEYEEQLSSLLALEEKRAGADPPPTPNSDRPSNQGEEEVEEVDFEADVLSIIADGRDWEHAKIKEAMEARGWSIEKGSLGRAIHGTLLSLMQNKGLVESRGKGIWRLTAKAKATAA